MTILGSNGKPIRPPAATPEGIDHNSFKPRAVYAKPDKPDVNPFDTSPQTAADAIHHAKCEAALQGMVRALQKARPPVSMQIMAESASVRPHLEGELPRIDGIRHGIFLFSVEGIYQGTRWGPCLLGNDCMLISAASPSEARALAADGLEFTLYMAREHAFTEAVTAEIQARNAALAQNAGIAIEAERRGKH